MPCGYSMSTIKAVIGCGIHVCKNHDLFCIIANKAFMVFHYGENISLN